MYDSNHHNSQQDLAKYFDKKMPVRASAYQDIDSLLEIATELRVDIISVIDSCMA